MNGVREIILWAATAGFAGFFAAYVVARWKRELIRQLERAGRFARRLSPVQGAVLAVLLFVCVLWGSVKGPLLSVPRPTAPVVLQLVYEDPTVSTNVVRAENWWRRGASDDWMTVGFEGDWRFPFGTGHLSQVTVLSRGEVRARLRETNAVARTEDWLRLAPYRSEFHAVHTPSNTYRFAWRDCRGATNGVVDAAIELFRNGDVTVRENGAMVFTPRELPFAHDGYGQDEAWVQANVAKMQELVPTLTNADEVLSVGYANWVDEQVGIGLTNGLYKFTVSFDSLPLEVTRFEVGDYVVCVTNAGEYVFLLEKGVDYSFGAEPFVASVRYSYADDITPPRPVLRAPVAWGENGVWSVAGGDVCLSLPTLAYFGVIRWMPKFQGSPNVVHVGPDDCPIAFTAFLWDVGPSLRAEDFYWTASSPVRLSATNGREVELLDDLPSWSEISLNVTTHVRGEELTSSISFACGTNDTPQVRGGLNLPSALLLRDDWIEDSRSAFARVVLNADVATSGVVRITIMEGTDKVSVGASGLGDHAFEDSETYEAAFPIDGIAVSSEVDDVTLLWEYLDASGNVACSGQGSLTVVSPQRISVNQDAVQDVAVLINSSLRLAVLAEPTASVIPSTTWYDAKLRSDRTYTGWRGWGETGTGISHVMGESGVFIVKARVLFSGPQWADVRYAWTENENSTWGIRFEGDVNHIGVASTQGQLDLRAAARAMLGSTTYAQQADLLARNGFSAVSSGDWKCNAFVADVAIAAGLTVPVQHRVYHPFSEDGCFPPTANEWANGNVEIVGWRYLGRLIWPEPGFMVGHPATVGSGHVGVTDFDGEGIGAGEFMVHRRYEQFLDGTSGFNQYTGESADEE